MIKIPTSGYSYPLGPKIEKPLIPAGYIELENAVDSFGREMFPDEWTGEERGFFGSGAFGQEFRSKIELETDQVFRDAVLMAQCELECESYGGDAKQRYKLRITPQNDDEPFMPMGDLPQLSPEAMKEIEQRFSGELIKAKAIRDRREKVEDKFLRELLWGGTLRAHCVEWGGRIVEIKPHTWGGPFGKPTFERGWINLPTDDGGEISRSILIRETDMEVHLSSPPVVRRRENDVADGENTHSAPRFSKAEVRTWYISYIEQLTINRAKSSRDGDVAAARNYFGINISRDFMRELRRELAPESWTARGAPKRK